jgi:hypothetical protein
VHRRTGIPYTQISGGPQELSTYKFFVGQLGELDYIQFMEDSCRNRSVGLGNLRINRDVEFQVMFPDNIEELVIRYCNDASSLCDVSSPIKYAASLECLKHLGLQWHGELGFIFLVMPRFTTFAIL